MLVICFVISVFLFNNALCANILAIVATPSYSHQKTFYPLWKELAAKGHHITLLTTHPIRNASLTTLREIDLSFAIKYVDEEYNMDKELVKTQNNILEFLRHALTVRLLTNEKMLMNAEIQDLIHNKSKHHFDLIMLEHNLPTFMGFQHVYDAPTIMLLSLPNDYLLHYFTGGVNHPVIYAPIFANSDYTTFFNRLVNFIETWIYQFTFSIIATSMAQESMQKFFGNDCPSVMELGHRIDMVFMNRQLVLHEVKPEVPAQINIGGMHINPPQPLTQELKTYLDNSKHGVIFFSLGSSVKCKDIPIGTLNVIKDTFRELPFDILWKFELPVLDEKPDNVKIVKWAQQEDILRHPNLKLFITQGGLQSIEEALYSHNTMLVLPVAADQNYNAQLVVSNGYGLSLNIQNLNKDEFKNTILELINNPKYKNKIKEMVDLSLDEPMTTLEKAIWWTEYVIRNKGAQHLKGAGIDMPMYQYLMLDVITFIFLILGTLVVVCIALVKLTINQFKKMHIAFSKKQV